MSQVAAGAALGSVVGSAEADGDKLGQVLAHLLDNAIRYSPAGGTVTVAARRKADAVEVSVEDEGVGIPHAEQERIFRKFYRGDAAAGAVGAGATGLGLFLIRYFLGAFWNGEIRARVVDPAVPTVAFTLALPDPRTKT